jgi:tRNA-dihydrouridine synthase B
MAGYTGSVFRQIQRESGCAYCCTEMVSAKGLIFGGDNSEGILSHTERDRPLAVQLFGEDPIFMVKAARKVQDPAFGGFEVIDLNMGCPARKVTSPGSGGGLLKDLPRAADMVRAVKEVAEVPVTVKIRLGWDHSQDPCEIASALAEAGADMLVLHGRTVSQGFTGSADWDAIQKVAESVSVPVVGNGDITSAEEAISKANLGRLSGVMVGRAILGNPFFFRQCIDLLEGREKREYTTADKMFAATEHFRRTIEDRGPRRGLMEMRKQLAFYLRGVKGAAKFRERINNEPTPEGVLRILEEAARS